MYISTPVYADGVLYGLSAKRKGQFVALDARTGALKWATEGRVAKRDGTKFVEEKRYGVGDSETWPMPAVVSDGLIVRDSTGLTRFTW